MRARKYVLSIFILNTIVYLSITILSPPPLIAKEIIVAIGDSITQADTHWTVQGHKNTIQGGWVTRLESILNKSFPDKYEVINKGINGDTALGVLNRLERDVIMLNPEIVIIAIGTNDIFSNLSKSPYSTPDFYQTAMTRIFDKLRMELPDTPIFVMGMTIVLRKYAHMRFGDFLPPQETLQIFFNNYNQILKDLSEDFGFFYVDIKSKWPSEIEESWKFFADGIHPNDEGYDLMEKTLYNALLPTIVHP